MRKGKNAIPFNKFNKKHTMFYYKPRFGVVSSTIEKKLSNGVKFLKGPTLPYLRYPSFQNYLHPPPKNIPFNNYTMPHILQACLFVA